MFNKRQQDYAQTLQAVSESPAGQKLLKYLHEEFVEASSLDPNPHVMAYKVGQKELVQDLLTRVKLRPEDLDDIPTYDIYED